MSKQTTGGLRALGGQKWRWARWAALALLVLPQPLYPAVITVDDSTSTVASDGLCSLPEAIDNANADADTTGGDCVAGSGADTALLTTSVSLTVVDTYYAGPTGLPVVTTDITVDGAGFTIERVGERPRSASSRWTPPER